MDRKELYKQLCEMEKKAEADEKKRNAITIAAFTIVYFLFFYFLGEKPEGIGDFITTTVVSFMAAAFHFGINAAVFGGLYEKRESDQRFIEQLKKKLQE